MLSSPPKKNEALSVDFHGAAIGKWADIFGLENIQPLNPHHKRINLLSQQLRSTLAILNYTEAFSASWYMRITTVPQKT